MTPIEENEARQLEIGRKWESNSSLEEWFPFTAKELDDLKSQVAALTKEKDRYENALGEWEEREAKVCPENVSFESVIAALTKERDEAYAACAAMRDPLEFAKNTLPDSLDNEDGPIFEGCAIKALATDAGKQILDRLHALTEALRKAKGALEGYANREPAWPNRLHDTLSHINKVLE